MQQGTQSWMSSWKRNGWRTANGQAVKNVELWQSLDQAIASHQITWHWVKGHAGHPENERCDELARQAAAQDHDDLIVDDTKPFASE